MATLVAVFGATGTQGGSVARALLDDDRSFKVRAVTRNPNGEKAQELANLGAEVVKANLDDDSSLVDAVSGCYGVFGVTNYNEHFHKDREVKQGKALVDACKNGGVKHLIFSCYQSGKDVIEVPMVEGKAEIESYMLQSGVPCTSVRYAWYMENFLGFLRPQRQHNGSYNLAIPIDAPMGLIAAKEAGKAVAAIFRCPDRYFGKVISFGGDNLTAKQMAAIMTKHLAPKLFRSSQIPLDEFARMGFPGSEEIAGLFDFMQNGNVDLDVGLTRHLDPGTKTFQEWVVANKDNFEDIFSED